MLEFFLMRWGNFFFILVLFVQKYKFWCFSCENINFSVFRAIILFGFFLYKNISIFMLFMIQTCSHQLVRVTCNKRHLYAVLQNYSQGTAEKGVLMLSYRNILKKWQGNMVLKEVVQKYSCPATHRGRTPMKKYYLGWCKNIHFKINIHPCLKITLKTPIWKIPNNTVFFSRVLPY